MKGAPQKGTKARKQAVVHPPWKDFSQRTESLAQAIYLLILILYLYLYITVASISVTEPLYTTLQCGQVNAPM